MTISKARFEQIALSLTMTPTQAHALIKAIEAESEMTLSERLQPCIELPLVKGETT